MIDTQNQKEAQFFLGTAYQQYTQSSLTEMGVQLSISSKCNVLF